MTPFSVLIIKKFAIRRGYGPDILADILDAGPLSLRKLRSWTICVSSTYALADIEGWSQERHDQEIDFIRNAPRHDSWVCLFTHADGITDPHAILKDSCGDAVGYPAKNSILYRYGMYKHGNIAAHPADVPVYLVSPQKSDLIASVLFQNFQSTNL